MSFIRFRHLPITCRKCGEEKAVHHFAENKQTASGHAAVCKPCFNTNAAQMKPRKEQPSSHQRAWGCIVVQDKDLIRKDYVKRFNGMRYDSLNFKPETRPFGGIA